MGRGAAAAAGRHLPPAAASGRGASLSVQDAMAPAGQYQVQEAPTGRAKCQACKEKIEKVCTAGWPHGRRSRPPAAPHPTLALPAAQGALRLGVLIEHADYPGWIKCEHQLRPPWLHLRSRALALRHLASGPTSLPPSLASARACGCFGLQQTALPPADRVCHGPPQLAGRHWECVTDRVVTNMEVGASLSPFLRYGDAAAWLVAKEWHAAAGAPSRRAPDTPPCPPLCVQPTPYCAFLALQRRSTPPTWRAWPTCRRSTRTWCTPLLASREWANCSVVCTVSCTLLTWCTVWHRVGDGVCTGTAQHLPPSLPLCPTTPTRPPPKPRKQKAKAATKENDENEEAAPAVAAPAGGRKGKGKGKRGGAALGDTVDAEVALPAPTEQLDVEEDPLVRGGVGVFVGGRCVLVPAAGQLVAAQ